MSAISPGSISASRSASARPALEVVLEAFRWTLGLAGITMALVALGAIVLGSLAAFRAGGVFDRIATFFSLVGATAPDFWIAIVGIVLFAVKLGWLPTSGTGTPICTGSCRSRCCSSAPSG